MSSSTVLRRDRVERRGGLVEQQDLRLHRNGAGDAEALLLAAGERQAALMELVLHLVPERGSAQRLLDAHFQLAGGDALVEADAEGDVVVDRHREGRRLLEDHADLGAEQVQVLTGIEDVVAVDQHFAGGALAGIELVDAVQDAQQGRLAAARRDR